jgi:hypothetical protein
MHFTRWLLAPVLALWLIACTDSATSLTTYIKTDGRTVSELQVFSKHGVLTGLRIATKQLESDGTMYWSLFDVAAGQDGAHGQPITTTPCASHAKMTIHEAAAAVMQAQVSCLLSGDGAYRQSEKTYAELSRDLDTKAGRLTAATPGNTTNLEADLKSFVQRSMQAVPPAIVKLRVQELLDHASAGAQAVQQLQSVRSKLDIHAKDVASAGRAQSIRGELLFDKSQMTALSTSTKTAIDDENVRIAQLDARVDGNECFATVTSADAAAARRESCASLSHILAAYNDAKRRSRLVAHQLEQIVDEGCSAMNMTLAAVQ